MKKGFAKYGVDLEYALGEFFPIGGSGRLQKIDDVPRAVSLRSFLLYWTLLFLIPAASVYLCTILKVSPLLSTLVVSFGVLFSLFYLPVLVFRRIIAPRSSIYKRVEQELLIKQGIKE